MKKFELKDIIPMVTALLGGGVTIFVAKDVEYKIPVSIGFFVLAVIFFMIPLFRNDKKIKFKNMEELKKQLIEKFTISELLDLIHNNFKDHFLKKGYAGTNPALLDITIVIRDLVTYCDMNDKFDELKTLLKK